VHKTDFQHVAESHADNDSAPFLLPTLQIFWAIIAFAQSTVTQNWHLYLLRAITGFLEASSFGGTHLIRMSPISPLYPSSLFFLLDSNTPNTDTR
jgi:hypothetical protein